MRWEIEPSTEKPDPELEKAISEAARTAAAVDLFIADVPLGTRIIALAGLVGIAAARADAALEPILDLIRSFYQEERERIANRGH